MLAGSAGGTVNVYHAGPLPVLSGQYRLRDRSRQLGEDRLQAPDYGFEQADAAPECPINVGFDRALIMQIDSPNCFVP